MTNTTTLGRLEVPGATLHWETLGSGPLLALVGHPMGTDDFRELARELAAERTVLLHDPRGFGASPLADPDDDADPDVLADDVARLVEAVGGAPAEVFGSSGGAVTALALAARHPGLVRTVVAHEPPLVSALPDAEGFRAQAEAVVALLHERGPGPAFGAFMVLAGFDSPPEQDPSAQSRRPVDGGADQREPSPEEADQVRTGYRMLAHALVPVCTWPLPEAELRADRVRVVLAAGEESGSQLSRRAAEAVAGRLGTPLALFPGGHAPWVTHMGGDPVLFAARLREVLAD